MGVMRRLGLVLILALSMLPSFALGGELPRPLSDEDFPVPDRDKAEIGRLLFYDPVLSGNRNIACATCHHHSTGSSDDLSLGIGEGGRGVGLERVAGDRADRISERIPRNSPALWNLGASEISVLFHDGRLEISDRYGNGFDSPAAFFIPPGLDSILAAQALFPLISDAEMAGNPGENEIADAAYDRGYTAWPLLAARIKAIPAYATMFVQAFDDIAEPEDITITHIAKAIAAFEAMEWRNHDSPFDGFLAGDDDALDDAERRGLALFYGRAGCDGCHGGPLLSDQQFHALGLPSFGPGKPLGSDPVGRDIGRMAKTGLPEDIYRFRTPSLRNVTLTSPYGHNGAFPTLEAMVRHHANPKAGRAAWEPSMAALPRAPWLAASDFTILEDEREMARQVAVIGIETVQLSDGDVADLLACSMDIGAVVRPSIYVSNLLLAILPIVHRQDIFDHQATIARY